MLFTTERREVSSAKCLQLEDSPSVKTFIKTTINKGPKIELSGTPKKRATHSEILSVFDNEGSHVKLSKDSQKYHFSLV